MDEETGNECLQHALYRHNQQAYKHKTKSTQKGKHQHEKARNTAKLKALGEMMQCTKYDVFITHLQFIEIPILDRQQTWFEKEKSLTHQQLWGDTGEG